MPAWKDGTKYGGMYLSGLMKFDRGAATTGTRRALTQRAG
jgi:hypothetical protein